MKSAKENITININGVLYRVRMIPKNTQEVQIQKNNEIMKCKRIVYNGMGGTNEILVDAHSFSWTGSMPCTGSYACIYCHKTKEEIFGGNNV